MTGKGCPGPSRGQGTQTRLSHCGRLRSGAQGAGWACRGLSWAWPQVSACSSPSPIFLLLLVSVLWASALSIHSEHKKGQKDRKSPEEESVHVSPVFTLGSPPFRLVPEEAPVTRLPSVASVDPRTACACVCYTVTV